MAKVRWYRRRWVWVAALVLLTAASFAEYEIWDIYGPSDCDIPISPETTYITEPLGADGMPDYQAYMMREASAGVTPENNAAALLIHAFPKGRQAEIDKDTLTLLKVGTLDPAECLVMPYDDFISSLPPEVAASLSPTERLDDQYDLALKTVWTAKQYPALAYWVEKNQRALAIAREASKRPCWFVADIGVVSSSDPFIEISRALAIRANLRAGEGHFDDAAEDLMAVHRLARLVSKGNGICDHWTAIKMESIACQAWLAIINDCDLNRPDAQRMLDRLGSLPPLTGIGLGLDHQGRFSDLTILIRASKEGSDKVHPGCGNAPVQKVRQNWSKVLRTYNRGMSEIVAAAKEPNILVSMKKLEALEKNFQAAAMTKNISLIKWELPFLRTHFDSDAEFWARRPAEYLLAENTNLVREAKSHAVAITQMHMAKIGLTMAMYKADVGHWPAKLEDLVPKYLPAVPVDCFSDKPYVYVPGGDGFVLYSIGEDLVDNKGSDGLDIVLRRTARALPSPASAPAKTPATMPA